MICAICNHELQISKTQPLVRCTNKKCTAYNIRMNKKAVEDGLVVNFIEFWDVYPKKVGKHNCLKTWAKLNPDKELRELIVVSVAEHRFCEQWENPQYIPMPSTFLNGQKWQDTVFIKEIPPPPKPAPSYNAPIGGYHKPKPMPESTSESKNKKQQAFDKINKMFHRPAKKLKGKTGKQNKFDFMTKDFKDLEGEDV